MPVQAESLSPLPDTLTFFCPNCGEQVRLAYHLFRARLSCPQCPCVLDVSWHHTEKAGHLTVSAFTDAPIAVVQERAPAEQPKPRQRLLYAAA